MTASAGLSDRSPIAYYTLLACFFGYMLNATNVWILDVAIRDGGLALVKTRAEVVLIDTATLLTSAGGGWLAGWLSDRLGRVLTLHIMIWVLAVSTFLCGFADGYASLFVWRAIMGVGFGGQWAAAAVLVGEAFGPDRRGLWVGVMQSGWAIGWGIAFFVMPPLARLLQFILQELQPILHLSPPDVWQMLFWISGLLPVLVILYMLFWRVEESSLTGAAREKADALEIFSPEKLPTTFWTCVLSIGALSGYWAILFWLPVFLKEYVSEQETWYRAVLIIGSGAGYFLSAWFSDVGRFCRFGNFMVCAIVAVGLWLLKYWDITGTSYLAFVVIVSGGAYFLARMRDKGDEGDVFGRRRNFVIFAIFTIVSVFASIYFAADKKIILGQKIIVWLAFPLGFFASGTFSGIGAFFTELFPTRMRGVAVGFTYSFGRGFAILFLWLIPWYGFDVAKSGLGPSIGVFVLISYGLVVIAALLLRETLGTDLKKLDVEVTKETDSAQPAAATT